MAGLRCLPAITLALLAAGQAGCSSDTTCKCGASCDSGVQYCWLEGDSTVCTTDFAPSQEDTGSQASLPDVESLPDATPEQDLQSVDKASPTDDVTLVDLPAEQFTPDLVSCEDSAATPDPGEFRGIWVTRWDYKNVADVEDILDKAASMGLNAVMFQVRGRADAFYDSQYEPWAKELTGTLGKDPGWDPLATAVTEAHARGLELHAWINTFTAWSGNSPPPACDPPHILSAHSDWLMVGADGKPMAYNDSYVFVSPGIPAVRDHIINVALDIVTGYDVDGLHFDYIRYAGPKYSHDGPSAAAFQTASQQTPGLSWEDFQRDTLSSFVAAAYDSLTDVRPDVKVSAAVWGIYKEEFGWGGTSQGFYDYYQDSHRWISEGLLDAICPMAYWKMTVPKGGYTDFATLTDDHLSAANGRHVYMGLKADYAQFSQVTGQIAYQAQVGGRGFVLFSYATLHSAGFDGLLGEYLGAAPPTPAMPWK